jgi:hypothetical protein
MFTLTAVTIVGLIFYWKIKPKLKRREHEAGLSESGSPEKIDVSSRQQD